LKKILKSDGMKAAISFVAAGYIWLVYKTNRWQNLNSETALGYMRDGKPFIMAFWHGRLLMMSTAIPSGIKSNVLISHHGDGEIIARAVKYWGLDSVRGSSSKGAVPAIKEMLRAIKRGELALITPDGPRGPRMMAQEGVVRVAAMSGVPVIPVSFSTSRAKYLRSWDRFVLAKPFGRGVFVWGDPINVPRRDINGGHQIAKRQIEESLIKVTQESDRLCGHEPVAPKVQQQDKYSTEKVL